MKSGWLLSLWLAAAAAAAEQLPAPQSVQEALYQDALQSIAEGRRSDASRELMRLIDSAPQHAGAWLDLAMTQCALGHAAEAEKLFATIESRFSPTRAILELIAEAREHGCNQWQPASSLNLAAGRGIDQNVNQGAASARYVVDAPGGQIEYELSSDFTPRHDQYTTLWGDYTREITPNGSTAFVQFGARRNDHLHQYDNGSLYAGVDTPWRWGGWSLRTNAALGIVTLGGRLYERQALAQLRATVPLPLPAGMQLSVLAGAGYNNFMTLTNFNGRTAELRALLSLRREHWFASASVGHIDDRALAQRPGGNRQGMFANLLARRQLGGRLGGELAYTRQTWQGSQAYSPGLINQVRDQTTQVGRAALTWALGGGHALQLEGRVVRNHENISIFQYHNRMLQLSWQWQGQ